MCQKLLSALDALYYLILAVIPYEILAPFYKEIKAQIGYVKCQGHKTISIAPGFVTRYSYSKAPTLDQHYTRNTVATKRKERRKERKKGGRKEEKEKRKEGMEGS